MDDAIEVGCSKDLFERICVADVRLDKIVVAALKVIDDICAFDLGLVEIVEVVDDCYAPGPFGKQTIDQVRSDESRSTGYKNLFHEQLVFGSQIFLETHSPEGGKRSVLYTVLSSLHITQLARPRKQHNHDLDMKRQAGARSLNGLEESRFRPLAPFLTATCALIQTANDYFFA